LLFRRQAGELEFFLAHPGGPFWKHKDAGAWTIPKGLVEEGEDFLAAAQREFTEETGLRPAGPFLPLGFIQQKAGKIVHAWACEGDADPSQITSNLVSGSRGRAAFPEIDRCEWFTAAESRLKINPAQVALLERLEQLLGKE
jgi:predicted NUDIX family NTP pyrophosphohydrolase